MTGRSTSVSDALAVTPSLKTLVLLLLIVALVGAWFFTTLYFLGQIKTTVTYNGQSYHIWSCVRIENITDTINEGYVTQYKNFDEFPSLRNESGYGWFSSDYTNGTFTIKCVP